MASLPSPVVKYTKRNSIAIPQYFTFTGGSDDNEAALFIKNLNQPNVSASTVSKMETNIGSRIYSQAKYLLDILSSASGYINFLLLQADMPTQEKYNLLRMAGDQYMVHFTGREPPVFSFGGVLVNAMNANQLNDFIAAYNLFMRASATSRFTSEVSLHFDNKRIRGQMVSLTSGMRGEQQLAGSFSFQILVRKVSLKLSSDLHSISGQEEASAVNLQSNPGTNDSPAAFSLTSDFG